VVGEARELVKSGSGVSDVLGSRETVVMLRMAA